MPQPPAPPKRSGIAPEAGVAEAVAAAEQAMREHQMHVTLGGEPTLVPDHPTGAEWSYTAVGPTKLAYALRLANALIRRFMQGALQILSPGKLYPGETNPRWVLNVLQKKDGTPFFPAIRGKARPNAAKLRRLRSAISRRLRLKGTWMAFTDPQQPGAVAWALPLDARKHRWISSCWRLRPSQRKLLETAGPAGLRLPLGLLHRKALRRALTLEIRGGELRIFLPPLLQEAFLRLLEVVHESLAECGIGRFALDGYLPDDSGDVWTRLGIAADPGVIEINLPPCHAWGDYDRWLRQIEEAAKDVGLRSWKEAGNEHPAGTGGGNHLLWGAEAIENSALFRNPAWIASLLRYFHHHPSLSYLFIGSYVGASSQAPRADESGHELFDLELAYRGLERLPEGDQRRSIQELLRHLHTDSSGNPHRAEISFDKFWNAGAPSGCLGLIEFRAIESLPKAAWSSAVAALFSCVAARLLRSPFRKPLHAFGSSLHDRFFLPTELFADLENVLTDIQKHGLPLPSAIFREVWEWRFPRKLSFKGSGGALVVRHAHESWPLLAEIPADGGSTSRYVDTSMRRFEISADPGFDERWEVRLNGREVPLRSIEGGQRIAGIRYRHQAFYPSLHPHVAVQVPLTLEIFRRDDPSSCRAWKFDASGPEFRRTQPGRNSTAGKTCRTLKSGDFSYDLRLP